MDDEIYELTLTAYGWSDSNGHEYATEEDYYDSLEDE